jgi:hypothetical protein
MNIKELAKKFKPEDIEWRVQSCGITGNKNSGGKPWALIIPYVTNRAIQQRLDDVAGGGNWKNEYKQSPCGNGTLCGISIKIGDEWITRWDGAENPTGKKNEQLDAVKTALSNSMKRAGVQWGIGRYLYELDAVFAICDWCDYRSQTPEGFNYQYKQKKGEAPAYGFAWKAPELPVWARPLKKNEILGYQQMLEECETKQELKKAWSECYKMVISECNSDLQKHFEEIKDRMKADFEEAEEAERKEQADKRYEIIAGYIDHINAAVNDSAAKGLTVNAIDQLGKILSKQHLHDAVKKLKAAETNKLKQLNGGQYE